MMNNVDEERKTQQTFGEATRWIEVEGWGVGLVMWRNESGQLGVGKRIYIWEW